MMLRHLQSMGIKTITGDIVLDRSAFDAVNKNPAAFDGEGQRPYNAGPDALLISDDNLVEHATAGLVAAGARVPEDVEVVAHCNFPWPTPSVLSVERLGYDAREVLDRCLRAIDDRRSGVPGSDNVDVPVRFEREVRGEDAHSSG